jgi:hypothetical protein
MSFKVGEVVILAFSETRPERVGDECVIVEGPCTLPLCAGGHAFGYRVESELWGAPEGSGFWLALPHQLRRKPPPSYPDQFTAGDWDLIPWQPQRERA